MTRSPSSEASSTAGKRPRALIGRRVAAASVSSIWNLSWRMVSDPSLISLTQERIGPGLVLVAIGFFDCVRVVLLRRPAVRSPIRQESPQ